jgi:hypothetical protein
MIERQSGLLQEESAQLLKPQQSRSRVGVTALRIDKEVFIARELPWGSRPRWSTETDRK